jgi:hypothetical protein
MTRSIREPANENERVGVYIYHYGTNILQEVR